ncbi:unnamed protein product [Paramecium sonneborni]|uniref:Uncharacterized protein n=1 Tax=Paramecium sonneborni TaxID=65129 RepID=A0A8S1R8B5_9CILI|nr:unnamed protein product [Paramecium sonneborni]
MTQTSIINLIEIGMQQEIIDTQSHKFDEDQIEITWSIQKGVPQNQDQINQQSPYQIINIGQNEDLGYGPGVGARAIFTNKEELIVYQDQNSGQYLYFDQAEKQWFPFQQKADEIINKIKQQQNQNDEKVLIIKVSNHENFNEYKGQITEKELAQQSNNIMQIDDMFQMITENIQKIFDKTNAVYLEINQKEAKLMLTLKTFIGRRQIDIPIKVPLPLIEQNEADKKKIKKIQQNKKFDEIYSKISKLEQLQEQQKQLNSKLDDIYSKIQKLEQNQKLQQLEFQLQQQNQQFAQIWNKIQKLEKDQQPKQYQKINNLSPSYFDNNNIYKSEKLKGCYELELTIQDDETDFALGIIQDDDLSNLQKKSKSYLLALPKGILLRGEDECGQMISHNLQLEDKLSIRVDSDKCQLQLVINDHALPPIKIGSSMEEFSFIIKWQGDQQLEEFAQI